MTDKLLPLSREELDNYVSYGGSVADKILLQARIALELQEALLEAKEALESCETDYDDGLYYDSEKVEKALTRLSALNLGEKEKEKDGV